MKKYLLAGLLFVTFLLPLSSANAVYVSGYYRSNGTYVQGYQRTAPDSSPYNNYSYPGNYNPNTGSITGGSAATYLNNYYGTSGTYSAPSYSYPTTPTCPLNSSYNGSSCTCYSGYVVGSSGSCVNGSSYCMNTIGLMSQYNSLSNKCECMSGYQYDGTSCKYKPTNYGSTYSSYSPTSSCPANSSLSLTDSTKCFCDAGYQNNSTNNGCVANTSVTSGIDYGCVTGAKFSSVTGKPCVTTASETPGCVAGARFSATTGFPCAKTYADRQVCDSMGAQWDGTSYTSTGQPLCRCYAGTTLSSDGKKCVAI